MSTQQTLLEHADPAPATEAASETASASAALRQDLLSCSRFLALLAAQLEPGEGEAMVARPTTARAFLEAEFASLLSDRLEGDGPNPRGIDVAAEVARIVEEALGRLGGRSEEEQRLRDWIELLQGAALPLLQQIPLRPHFAGQKSIGGRRVRNSARIVDWTRARRAGKIRHLSIVPREENQGMRKSEHPATAAEPAAMNTRPSGALSSTDDSAMADAADDPQPQDTTAAEPSVTATRRGLRAVPGRTPLSEARATEIRERILQGAYNSLAVVDEVARRMLRRGDI